MPDLSERYKAAIDTHKHYDNLSLAVVTGMIVVVGASFTIADEIKNFPAFLVFIACVGVLIAFFTLYHSFSRSAGIARNVSANIEAKGNEAHSISEVFTTGDLSEKHLQPKGLIYRTVLSLNVLLCLCMLVSAWLSI
jgi:hypothetical protein